MQKIKISKEQAVQRIRHFCAYQERAQQEVRDKLYSFSRSSQEVEEIIAAAKDKANELVKIIQTASEARPVNLTLTDAQKKDWEKFIKNDIDKSFDIWMSIELGYIKLKDIALPNNRKSCAISRIYGRDRRTC